MKVCKAWIIAALIVGLFGMTSGGWNSGTQGNVTNKCFVVDSPQLRGCEITPPWQNFFRLNASLTLPWGISTAVGFLGNPGPVIPATWTLTNANIGQNAQFVNPARTTFSAGSAAIPLVISGTQYADRLNQVDVRLAKQFKSRGLSYRLTLDVGNLLNSAATEALNTTYGTSWQLPTYILQGRVIKPGLLVQF